MRLLLIIGVVIMSAYRPVPLQVQDYIKTNLPGWHIVDTADYAKSWWSFYDKKQVPFFITIDLNDDQHEDYALLLKKADAVCLAVIISKGNSFTHWIANDFKEKIKDMEYGLAIEPPGQIDVLEPKEASLILRSNGIALMEMEQRSRIYYWSDGAIKVFYAK